MNQPYRVRIKTKVKVRIALILFAIGVGFYYLLQFDFGFKQDDVRYGQKYLLEATQKRTSGSYRGSTPYLVGKFELPNGKLIEARIYSISDNDIYCVAEVLVNGKVNIYQAHTRSKCV